VVLLIIITKMIISHRNRYLGKRSPDAVPALEAKADPKANPQFWPWPITRCIIPYYG
jgi:hypothetical protein